MKLLIATGNQGKLVEFQRILEPLGVEVVSPKEVGVTPEVEETGETFAENARLKAQELYDKTGIPTLADDSGMCIDALDGRPGVRTARYGGDERDYPAKFELLFEEMKEVPQEERTAAFLCHICCILDEDTVLDIEGLCPGTIGYEPRGGTGFGFDPIFYVENGQSFAELPPAEKDAVSHRGKAVREFYQQLSAYLEKRGEQ